MAHYSHFHSCHAHRCRYRKRGEDVALQKSNLRRPRGINDTDEQTTVNQLHRRDVSRDVVTNDCRPVGKDAPNARGRWSTESLHESVDLVKESTGLAVRATHAATTVPATTRYTRSGAAPPGRYPAVVISV